MQIMLQSPNIFDKNGIILRKKKMLKKINNYPYLLPTFFLHVSLNTHIFFIWPYLISRYFLFVCILGAHWICLLAEAVQHAFTISSMDTVDSYYL